MPLDIGHSSGPATETLGASPDEFLPDLHHIADDLVLLEDGSLIAMAWVPGYAFQLEGTRMRNIRRRQLEELFRNISDDNVTVGAHLVHHKGVIPFRLGRFGSNFARRVIERQTRGLSPDLWANDWFLTVMVSPRFGLLRTMRRRLPFMPKATADLQAGVPRQMDAILRTIMSYLGQDGARRLGKRVDEDTGIAHSEIAEARRLILYGRFQPVPMPAGRLGDVIYSERITCGTRAVRIDGLDGPRYAKTIAIKDYPAEHATGKLAPLLDLPSPFTMSQTFRFASRASSETSLYFKLTRLENAGFNDKDALERLTAAKHDLQRGDVRGDHNFAMTVFAPDFSTLSSAASDAGTKMLKAGLTPIAEDGNSFAAYWTQHVGVPDWMQGRAGDIRVANFTGFAGFENFPVGAQAGYWGRAVIRFATTGGTALDYHPHVGELGHTLVIGRAGSGKTLLMNVLGCALEQPMHDGGVLVYFDKDHGAEAFVRATGGRYLTLRSGEASGLAPLRGLRDTPEDRAFLVSWLSALIEMDGRGPVRPETVTRLGRAVARQLRMPASLRRIGAVRAFLDFEAGGDGERLDRWCHDGALGWLFDGDEDQVRLDAPKVGFDMTVLLKHPACPAVAAYLLHRIRSLIDGRRIAVICDECRFYLLNPMFADMIEDFALTLRKQNGMLWLAAQQPSHITGSSIGKSLVSQCLTRFVYPSKDADPADYLDGLAFTPAMFKAITETMPTMPYRTVLMQRADGRSAILRTDLVGMEDEILVLSGRTKTARVIPGILAEVGDDPDRFVDLYIPRAREALRSKDEEDIPCDEFA